MKKILLFIFCFFSFTLITWADDLSLHAKSAILIEESTGKVIYESNADEQLHPASMTKIMSLILIMDASISLIEIKSGQSFNVSNTKAFKIFDNTKLAKKNNAIICTADKVSILNDGTYVLPFICI